MAFCIDNSDSSEEVIDCVTESLVILETPLLKKVARLYLVSDIINNSTVRIEHASTYRNGFKKHFETIFTHFALRMMPLPIRDTQRLVVKQKSKVKSAQAVMEPFTNIFVK